MVSRKERREKESRHIIRTEMGMTCKLFDSIFTIAAVAWLLIGFFWFIRGDADKGVARFTLALAFWIASTQLQPYWDRFCPTRCAHQPEDPDKDLPA